MALLSLKVTTSVTPAGGSTPATTTVKAANVTVPAAIGIGIRSNFVIGPPGVGSQWKGLYNSGTTYAQGDGVTGSNGHNYISLVAGNLNHDPTTDAGVHWTDTIPTSVVAAGSTAPGSGTTGDVFLVRSDGTVARFTPPAIPVEAWGAVGDGVADDVTKIQDAINALPQPGNTAISGGRIAFKKGKTYKITTSLVCDNLVNVTLDGGSGGTHGGAQLNAVFTAGSAAPIISAQSATSFTMTGGLYITNPDTTYTGVGVELSKGAGANTDRAYLHRIRIALAANVACTAIGVSLQNAQACELNDCWITGGNYGVQGLKTAADFSNGVVVRKSFFQSQNIAPIHNVGAGWKITDENIFEPLRGGTVAAALLQDATVPAVALDYSSNWHGDATTGTWVVVNGSGISITGANLFDIATKGVQINAATNGLEITGNRFNGLVNAVDLNGQVITGAEILGNNYSGISGTKITNASSGFGAGAVVSDGSVSLMHPSFTETVSINQSTSSTCLSLNSASPTNNVLQTITGGDSNQRLYIDGNGQHNWGPGNAATDTVLQRLAANSLGVSTADLSVATVGRGLRVKEGSNAKQGVATLAAGTVVVSNTSVTASSRIMLTPQDNNTAGALRISARTAGTSFTILSSNGADTGVVAYQIFEPA